MADPLPVICIVLLACRKWLSYQDYTDKMKCITANDTKHQGKEKALKIEKAMKNII